MEYNINNNIQELTNVKDVEKENVDIKMDNKNELKINEYDELQNEVNKMIERNRMYLNLTNNKTISNNKHNITVKPIRRTYNKFKNISKNKNLTEMTQAGRELEKKMLEEISERRKKNKIKKEKKKAKKLEGELKVGNMTVIKDLSKIRKCDKKTKNKIYKLSSEVINKILKKN
ncbi:conserved Plasmodium protein, unknown function [Plasmodium gallinaceum]|uniref:Uncharacterized protein n=1 Tax=Plasmodium gallinaceum TaxID=5849 RepID=A0A1J1GTN5_PLAGA|nr:conserved Plasmodium protein, unknown function [Plasmodium gallinaceum]CRG95603.1 conserved Plasmodium protein, unknown function [Plasmodium gallinaceum]